LKQRPDIFLFHNYREYLKKWLAYRRLKSKTTLRSLARTLKISAGYLSDILAGHKPMTKPIYKNLCGELAISKSEKSFLWHLIELADADTIAQRTNAFNRIKRFTAYQARHQQEMVTHEFLSNWLTVVIRELATLNDFKAEPKWIREKLKYKANVAEIKSALRFLFKHGFLKKGSDGKVSYQDKLMRADHDVLKLAMAHYHSGFMDLAAKSIYVTPSEERHLLNYTVSIPQEAFVSFRDILEKTLQTLSATADAAKSKANPDSVYNVSLYTYPLTRPIRK
jgi:uncharacterized protein (TIGR02147 family)